MLSCCRQIIINSMVVELRNEKLLLVFVQNNATTLKIMQQHLISELEN